MFRDEHDAGAIPGIGRVVPGEEIPHVVECDLLRIPETGGVDLEIRPVALAPEHGAGSRIGENSTVVGDEVVSTIADRPVDPAVGAVNETVHVVAVKREAHSEARLNGFLKLRDAVPVRILQTPQMRDVRVPDLVPDAHHPGPYAVRDVVEGTREDGVRVVDPVTVGVDGTSDPVGHLRVVRHALLALVGPLLHVGDAVLHRERLKIVLQVPGARTIVHRAPIRPLGLGDEETAVGIDAEGDRILDQRLAGHHLVFEARGDSGSVVTGGIGRTGRSDCESKHEETDELHHWAVWFLVQVERAWIPSTSVMVAPRRADPRGLHADRCVPARRDGVATEPSVDWRTKIQKTILESRLGDQEIEQGLAGRRVGDVGDRLAVRSGHQHRVVGHVGFLVTGPWKAHETASLVDPTPCEEFERHAEELRRERTS